MCVCVCLYATIKKTVQLETLSWLSFPYHFRSCSHIHIMTEPDRVLDFQLSSLHRADLEGVGFQLAGAGPSME